MKYIKWLVKIAFCFFLMILLIVAFVAFEQVMKNKNNPPYSPYACGSFGDKIMEIDKKYLFLGIMHYEDIDYWSDDFLKHHRSKGCSDQVASTAIQVKWPSLEPWDSVENGKEKISIGIHQRTVFSEWQDREYWDYKIFIMSAVEKVNKNIKEYSNVKEISIFNKDLGLYELNLKEIAKEEFDPIVIPTRIYWKEYEDNINRVLMFLECTDLGRTRTVTITNCEIRYHLPRLGKNTSYMVIRFDGDLISSWNDILDKSLGLVNGFLKD